MSKKKRIAIIVGVLVVLGALVTINVVRDIQKRVAVQTQIVDRRDLVSTVTASGEVKPRRYVNVSSDVAGRITRLYVQEGDAVRQGQPLCQIDATRFEASTRQAAAALQSVRAELKRAEADLALSVLAFERTERMHDDRLVSDQTFDQARTEIQMKTAVVEQIKKRIIQQDAALEFSRDSLQKTNVISPMDGIVTLLQKEEGETVIGAESFQPTVIMTVADLSVMETEVMADETDIKDLALGQTAEIRVDAFQDVKIQGEITEIGASAIVRGATPGVATSSNTANQAKDFKVTITLKEPPKELRPGLNATAEITTARKMQVLAVPIQAVVVREIGDDGKVVDPGSFVSDNPRDAGRTPRGEEREGVFVVKDRQARFQPVKTGILGETDMEILDGIEGGEEIVSGSYKTLRTLKNEARIKIEKSNNHRAGKTR
ncbi:MAG: efflux RND transporter periplasmic adaptor subunit [Vicinamibacteria bacterium]|nr:efflux RND transporter periplasmic adaptor subunit [Vicinamibacteria bacterium]